MPLTMMKPQFVEVIPRDLREGILYVSTRYNTAIHLCACGCGIEVVTPLGPTQWKMTNQEGVVSLSPSIGSYQIPCKSHYWIRDNGIHWC
ncbi:hypothetical protein pEaSNUABM29_00188 [Erwinia phage pEa_SNUABM_29]|nr:hypothetical protein pEaSNUABM29_00188 [Erwinia phage pEa_SNUABM_29]